MKITDISLQDFAEDLVGTSRSIVQEFETAFPGEDFYSLSISQLGIIDSIMFECSDCGWNYEVGEESGKVPDEMVCINCAEYGES